MPYKNKPYENKNTDFSKKGINTKLIRSGMVRTGFGETSEPIFMNSGFCYNSAETAESRFDGTNPGFVYSRYVNPNLKILEDKLAAIENAEACCVSASGMAAVFESIMCQIRAGDHFIASKVLFGSCYYIAKEILPRYGIEVTLADAENLDEFESAFRPNTKVVFIETPANPTLDIVDIEGIAKICKKFGASLIVDNIFASAIVQKPLELGADIVVYSGTKYMDGQGKVLAGAVLSTEKFIKETLLPFHRHTGPALSPFVAWTLSKSLETYQMRIERHSENALKIAEFLSSHNKIRRVAYPHLKSHPHYKIAKKQMSAGGGMVVFEVDGNKSQVFKFLNALQIVDISNNLGDSKSLITHPSTTTHSNIDKAKQLEMGINERLCRLSVGLEDIEDLIQDLNDALKVI